MSEQQHSEIDFTHAQYEAPVEAACAVCKQPFATRYFSVNGHGVCEPCLGKLRAGQHGSFSKALALGTAAGAVGAGVYYAIRSATGYDLALITIVVGVIVGIGVRRGAGASRSNVYRAMAVGLTWLAMSSTYVPDLLAGFRQDGSVIGAAEVIFAAVLSLGVPYFMIKGAEVLGLIIFAVGIWEAWRRSAPPAFHVEGPFEPTSAATARATTAPLPTPAPDPAAS
jgi:hypothetical protein